jgi:putative transposase
MRYVEQNPLRAQLVERAEDWCWSRLFIREKGSDKEKKLLAKLPFDLPSNYLQSVNDIINKETLEVVRMSVNKCTPYGKITWIKEIVTTHGLIHTTRGRGRPKNN